MPSPLNPQDGPPSTGPAADHHPRSAWAKALAGAGGVCAVLGLVPGLGAYMALVVVPVLYLLGVPVARRTFTTTTDRGRQARRLIAAGAGLGALVPVVVSILSALAGPYDAVLLRQVLLTAVAGALVAAIAVTIAVLTPPRGRTALAVGGPMLLLISAVVQVALWW